jgi:hypothetical protein
MGAALVGVVVSEAHVAWISISKACTSPAYMPWVLIS